ncbi:hypothetical protein PAXRUDRAFT_42223, partial [Paxillus rubicundulus Ve08.2h10]
KYVKDRISDDARYRLKMALFTSDILPNTETLNAHIRDALHSVALPHLGAGVSEWLDQDLSKEMKKLKDCALNIRNDFKDAVRTLVTHLYGLTIPLDIQGGEVHHRQERVAELLSDFSYLDGIKTVSNAASGHRKTVPFGHPAIAQLAIHMLWNEKRYCRYLSLNTAGNRKNLDRVLVFSGTMFQWTLAEHSTGVFSPGEFQVWDNLQAHGEHKNHLPAVGSADRAGYDGLVDMIIARGFEMGG